MKDRFIRQSGLVNEEIFKVPITVVGVGGIGSFLVLALAKMGFESISIYDNDTIEEHNLPNQFYKFGDIKKKKTTALTSMVAEFCSFGLGYNSRQWMANDKTKGVLISCVDNMDAREAMFNYALDYPDRIPLFIDGRMGRLQAEIYTVKTRVFRDKKIYRSRLWKSNQVDDVPCTEKAIIYNVLFIASMICSQLKLALENKIYKPAIIADLDNTELTFLK